jgi:hypothetical protein
MSGQRSLESASSVPKQVGTVVCGPQLVTRICDQTDNGEFCLGAGIALANGHKSQAVIPNQPFAGADPEVAIARLRHRVDVAAGKPAGASQMSWLWLGMILTETAPETARANSRDNANRKRTKGTGPVLRVLLKRRPITSPRPLAS